MGPIAEMQLEMGTDISMLSGRSKYYWSHELLAFDDDGLLVRVDDKLVLVDYDAMVRYKHRNKRAVFTKKQTAGAIRSEIANMYNGGNGLSCQIPSGNLRSAVKRAFKGLWTGRDHQNFKQKIIKIQK